MGECIQHKTNVLSTVAHVPCRHQCCVCAAVHQQHTEEKSTRTLSLVQENDCNLNIILLRYCFHPASNWQDLAGICALCPPPALTMCPTCVLTGEPLLPADWNKHKRYCKRWVYSKFKNLESFTEAEYHADAENSEIFRTALEAAKARVSSCTDQLGQYPLQQFGLGWQPHSCTRSSVQCPCIAQTSLKTPLVHKPCSSTPLPALQQLSLAASNWLQQP